jgi:hypothetical protein
MIAPRHLKANRGSALDFPGQTRKLTNVGPNAQDVEHNFRISRLSVISIETFLRKRT